MIQTLTGRYYDADYGYVDLSTPVELAIYYGKNWPAAGTVSCSGAQGASAGIEFQTQNYSVYADVDNDKAVDWQAKYQVDSVPDVNMPPTANAGLDQSVVQGATVTLDGSASFDKDNDSLTYYWNVDSYPQGGVPSAERSQHCDRIIYPNTAGKLCPESCRFGRHLRNLL